MLSRTTIPSLFACLSSLTVALSLSRRGGTPKYSRFSPYRSSNRILLLRQRTVDPQGCPAESLPPRTQRGSIPCPDAALEYQEPPQSLHGVITCRSPLLSCPDPHHCSRPLTSWRRSVTTSTLCSVLIQSAWKIIWVKTSTWNEPITSVQGLSKLNRAALLKHQEFWDVCPFS